MLNVIMDSVVLIRVINISINLIIIMIINTIYYCSLVMVLIVFSSYEDCSYEFVEFHLVLYVSCLMFVQ